MKAAVADNAAAVFIGAKWQLWVDSGHYTDYAGQMDSGKIRAWSATLHVRPLPGMKVGLEGNPAGAYAVVLALARDEAEYREVVAAEMESLGLFIAEVDDLAPYEPDAHDDDIVGVCAARLSPDWPVQYHNFHAYPHDEA